MPPLPDLSGLTLTPHTAIEPEAPNGIYCLDQIDDLKACKSSIVVLRDAIPFDQQDTKELEDYMSDESKVSRTMTRYGTYLLRRHATFGAAYNFGQENTTIPYPVESWPKAVQVALETAKTMATQLGVDPSIYNAVHANWYPSGSAGVDAHADSESDMVKGNPIFSFTLLAGDIVPRNFSILRNPNAAEIESQRLEFERKAQATFFRWLARAKEGKKEKRDLVAPRFKSQLIPLYDVKLHHGDALIMQGGMQTYYLHSVAKDTRNALKNARRLNLTVRAFKQTVGEEIPKDDSTGIWM